MSGAVPVPARAGLDAVSRYEPGRSAATVDLSDSTNVWGAAPSAVAAITSGARDAWRYPSLYGEPLKAALARAHDVPPECIVTGCGSDDVLRSAFNAFGGAGAVITWMDPTFVIIPSFAVLLGLVARPVPFNAALEFDAHGLLATRAAITYLCSPNNPTGGLVAQRDLLAVVDAAAALVVIDEAYADYAGETLLAEAATRGNLLVTRTFSKSFGLAGLRVGYGVAHPDIVTAIERARGPYTVNLMAERAATAALTHDVAWMQMHVREAISMRDRLASALRALGFQPLPSWANFVCIPMRRAQPFADACAARGVLVRAFTGLPAIGDAVRVAAAPWEVLEQVVAAAREVGP